MSDTKLIVGIDVGITTAVALLDVSSDWYLTKSKKHWKAEDIASFILDYGEPILLATDVENIPEKVRKLSAILNVKIMKRRKNMQKFKKLKLVKNFKFKNQHQRDALASAIEAKKKLKPLISRIPVEEKDKVLALLLKEKKPNISEAVRVIYEDKSKNTRIRC